MRRRRARPFASRIPSPLPSLRLSSPADLRSREGFAEMLRETRGALFASDSADADASFEATAAISLPRACRPVPPRSNAKTAVDAPADLPAKAVGSPRRWRSAARSRPRRPRRTGSPRRRRGTPRGRSRRPWTARASSRSTTTPRANPRAPPRACPPRAGGVRGDGAPPRLAPARAPPLGAARAPLCGDSRRRSRGTGEVLDLTLGRRASARPAPPARGCDARRTTARCRRTDHSVGALSLLYALTSARSPPARGASDRLHPSRGTTRRPGRRGAGRRSDTPASAPRGCVANAARAHRRHRRRTRCCAAAAALGAKRRRAPRFAPTDAAARAPLSLEKSRASS